MAKLIEKGLMTNPNWHYGPFAGILLGGANQINGANVENPLTIISVTVNPTAAESFGIGTKTYTFVANGVTPSTDEIELGLTAAATATNIITQINTDRHNGTGCTAYTLGKNTLILLVDNNIESHHGAPGFSDAGCIGKLVEDMPWMNSISQHMLLDFDYFRVPLTDTDTKPISLTERNIGNYQNFLY